MTSASTVFSRFIGADVGKAEIVIFDSQTGKTSKIPNHPTRLASLAAGLDATCLVVCEATGGYEALLLETMLTAGIAAHRADARKVKAFIRSFGTLGKTDAIDARALAVYGQERSAKLSLWQQRDRPRQHLQSLVLTRDDFVKERVAYKNRLAAPGATAVEHHLLSILAALNKQIAAVEAEIKALIKADPQLARDLEILRTVPGLGEITASTLLALMPELGTLNRREAAALAGLAPHPTQSGAKDAYRTTKGGRPAVKRALFMAGLRAAQASSPFNRKYQTLIQNGKKPIVAVVAIMRKIIVIANARLRHQIPAA